MAVIVLSGEASAQAPSGSRAGEGSPPVLTYHIPGLFGTLAHGTFSGLPGDPVSVNYGGELTVTTDKLFVDSRDQIYQAVGDTKVTELTASLSAEAMRFDGRNRVGVASNAVLIRRPYLIHAGQISVTPTDIHATDADFTTASPGVTPGYSIRARRITLDPRTDTGIIENGSLYLFGTRIASIRRYTFTYGGGSGQSARKQLRPEFGYSTRYGAFVSADIPAHTLLPVEFYLLLPTRQSPQTRIIATQPISVFGHGKRNPSSVVVIGAPGSEDSEESVGSSNSATGTNAESKSSSTTNSPAGVLATLRAFALGGGVLPEGDPLLFQQFLPDATIIRPLQSHPGGGLGLTEEVSSHISSSGNNQDRLYVSRLPEARLTGVLPLTRVPEMPHGGDPVKFRRYLRKPVLYAGAATGYGKFYEQPTNIRHDRGQYQAWLSTSPVLIGQNTIVLPRLVTSVSRYDGTQDSYRYGQAALSLMHYVSDRTAYGFDYLISAVNGASPFNFDVLDAAQELDGRAQVGNEKIVVGGSIRYDLDNGRVIDYRVTLAPNVHGLIPIFTYDFRARTVDAGFAVDKVSF